MKDAKANYLFEEKALLEKSRELINDGVARMDAIKQAARERGMSKREAYQILESC